MLYYPLSRLSGERLVPTMLKGRITFFLTFLVMCLTPAVRGADNLVESAAEIDWRPADQLPARLRRSLPYFCDGRYVQPRARPVLNPGSIDASADQAFFGEDRVITLSGDVELPNRLTAAHEITV